MAHLRLDDSIDDRDSLRLDWIEWNRQVSKVFNSSIERWTIRYRRVFHNTRPVRDVLVFVFGFVCFFFLYFLLPFRGISSFLRAVETDSTPFPALISVPFNGRLEAARLMARSVDGRQISTKKKQKTKNKTKQKWRHTETLTCIWTRRRSKYRRKKQNGTQKKKNHRGS